MCVKISTEINIQLKLDMVCVDKGWDLRIIFSGGPKFNTELSYIILDPSNFLFKL